MKKMTIFAMLFILLALATAPCDGQQKSQAFAAPATDTMSVDQILDKYVEALGGKTAIEKVTSRVSKGTAEIIGMDAKGTIEIYEKAPNKQTRIVKIPGAFAWASGFNGTAAWLFNAASGKLEDKNGKELAVVKAESDFYQALKLRERYPKMSLKGVEKIQYRDGARDAYLIEATPAKGETEKLYFDTQSGLLIRHDTLEQSEEGKVPVREFLLDYKEVDGVKIPFTSRQAQGTVILLFKLTEVVQNVAIDEARFNKPAIR